MTKILITGGSGIVGLHLSKVLLEKGYEVSFLSRTNKMYPNIKTYLWDIDKGIINQEAINAADYIIHLAGANVGDKRWTSKRKKLILDSRTKSAELILKNLSPNNNLKAFISASATGYYGSSSSNKIFKESDPPGKDFLAHVCEKWEHAANKFQEREIRTVKIRTGLVLSKNDGALSKMILPIKYGLGSALGNGKQYMPWIHIDDLCEIYIKAIEDSKIQGAYNAVAPEHINNQEFSRTIAKQLKKPFWFPRIPSFVLKILFGEISEILLQGNKISSQKINSQGYKFNFVNLENALKNILNL